MGAVLVEILKVVGAALGALSAAFLAYCTIKAAKEKARQKQLQAQFGLADNPERCGRHEEAIAGLKQDVTELKRDNSKEHDEIFTQLQGISIELVRMGRNGGERK